MIRLLVSGILCLSLAAQTRRILPSGTGPQRLDVDLALLGATRNGLADLRIRDAAGRDVPYVLVPPDPRAAVWVSARMLPFLRRPSEPGVSRFTLRLPGPRIPLKALVLSVAGDGPLMRDAQVTESRLSASNLTPRGLGAARLRRAKGGAAYDLRIPVEAPEGSELDLRVQDGDNPGLELTGIRAELEPQPWIYFEARDAGPFTALCGDARMPRPRYDLEALKDQLSRASAARASWGAEVAAPPAPSAALDGGVGAPLDSGGFRFRRQVPAGTPGLAALALDAHVLASSPGLQDLRLLDKGGRQLPYLLESRDEPLSLDLAWPRGSLRERTTTYRVALPQSGLPASRLVLETDARVFRRRVRVLEGDPAQVRAVAEWSHGDPSAPAPALVLPLPGPSGRELAVEVEEGDNQALAIRSARLLLPSWRLRFFRPADPFLLCYGRDLPGPDYDLALLAGRLRDAPAAEIALSSETAPALGEPGNAATKVFWGALVLAVAGLLYLLARILARSPDAPH